MIKLTAANALRWTDWLEDNFVHLSNLEAEDQPLEHFQSQLQDALRKAHDKVKETKIPEMILIQIEP